MTNIYCSNKLKDLLGKDYFTKSSEPTDNLYGEWNGHLFNVGRQRYLIFVNNKSYYSVFIKNFKKTDFKDFSTFFLNRLNEQLINDGIINNESALLTLQKYSPLILSKTNNDKKALGTINDFIYNFKAYCLAPSWTDKNLIEINTQINNLLTGAAREKRFDYGRPIEDMTKLLNTSP